MRLFWISLISLLGSSMSVEEVKLGLLVGSPQLCLTLSLRVQSHQASDVPHHHLVNMLLGSVP